MDGLGRGRIQLREPAMRGVPVVVHLTRDPRACLRIDGRGNVQVGQGSPQVEARAAAYHCRAAIVDERVDLTVGELRECSHAHLLVECADRDETCRCGRLVGEDR